MELTLTALFVVSALLLILSILKTLKATKAEHKEIDMVHMSLMNEMNAIQESVRNLELDIEIVTKEAGVQLSYQEKLFLREILDLYKRKYSLESIAEKKQVSVHEIQQLLEPYMTAKDGRRTVAHEV